MHQDVLLSCVQDAHHRVGVISAGAPLPASRSCRCSHFLYRFRVHLLHLRFSQAGVGVDSAVAPLQSCLTAFLFIITPTGCRRPPVLTSMFMLSWDTPLVCYCAAALHASSFDLLCNSFYKCAFCFCCCCDVLSFDLIFRVISCVMYFISFFWRRLFFIVSTIS